MLSTHSVVMIALLPIAILNPNIPENRLDEQRQTKQEVLKEIRCRVLQRLTFGHNLGAKSGYYIILCADGDFRRCKLVLPVWLAEWPEYSDLHPLEQHVCFWCECSRYELGDDVPPYKQHPGRDHNLYRTLGNAIVKAFNAKLSSRHVQRVFNIFRHIPCIVSNLPNYNLLHSMQFGMLDHLQMWSFHLVKRYEQLDNCNAIRLSVPANHVLTLTMSHMKKCLNGMGRRWRKWADTCFELETSLYEVEAPLNVPCTIVQLSAHGHC